MDTTEVFQCETCGLHYRDETIAQQCESFCKEHNACGIEITKHSIETASRAIKLEDVTELVED